VNNLFLVRGFERFRICTRSSEFSIAAAGFTRSAASAGDEFHYEQVATRLLQAEDRAIFGGSALPASVLALESGTGLRVIKIGGKDLMATSRAKLGVMRAIHFSHSAAQLRDHFVRSKMCLGESPWLRQLRIGKYTLDSVLHICNSRSIGLPRCLHDFGQWPD